VYVFKQRRSPFYHVEAFIDGRKARKSLRTDRLPTAFKLAIDWHKRLLKEARVVKTPKLDRLGTDPTIAELFDSYRLTLPSSKRAYADMKWNTIENYWRTIEVGDVTPQTFRDFYKWRRRKKTPAGTVVKNHSIHKDMMVIRQVLKYAIEEGHLQQLPIIPKVGKIEANPRPWLTRAEWDHLMTVCFERLCAAENPRVRGQRQDLEDFLYCLLESTMRVSELRGLTAGQVRIDTPKKGEPYAVIQVRGKTGYRTAIAGGVFPTIVERRAKGLKPGDLLWPHSQRDAFRELLLAAGLRTDEFGNPRNLKSIRATAISFRILAGAPSPNLLLIARNAGTSVTMLDNFYAKRLTAELGVDQLSGSLI
jgi:hypothetical protein